MIGHLPNRLPGATDSKRWLATGAVAAALLLYGVGLEWPLLLAVVVTFAVFLPLPRLFSSWLSRTVVALLLLYAFVQAATVLQFLLLPSSKFGTVAILVAFLAIGAIWSSGTYRSFKSFRLVNRMDLFAALGCVTFLTPFIFTLAKGNHLAKISQLADSQIVDTITHYRIINDFLAQQHLNYTPGVYYPSGFHISTAFIEHSLDPSILQSTWSVHVWVYLLQYLISGLLLGFTFVYFVYGLARAVKLKTTTLTLGVIGVTAGGLITVMHLLLFTQAGFLNYFYICATLLMAIQFLLEVDYEPEGKNFQLPKYTWEITYYLVLCAGAALTWPLFVPISLLPAAIIVLPNLFRARQYTAAAVKAYLPIALATLLNLVALYFQLAYTRGGQNIDASGAVHNFNSLFLLVGCGALGALLCFREFSAARKRIVLVYFPYLLLVLGLMVLQYYAIGSPRYYLIKSDELLEMLLLAALLIAVMHIFTRHLGSSLVWGLAPASIAVAFIVVVTLGSVPQPFNEIRGLFRAHSHFPSPPFLYEDSAAVAKLGGQNKLENYNLAVLHYQPEGGQIFAQAEISYWANSLANVKPSAAETLEADDYSDQYAALAYGYGNRTQQVIIGSTKGCIAASMRQRIPYYIVTDGASAAYLRQIFGNEPTYIIE